MPKWCLKALKLPFCLWYWNNLLSTLWQLPCILQNLYKHYHSVSWRYGVQAKKTSRQKWHKRKKVTEKRSWLVYLPFMYWLSPSHWQRKGKMRKSVIRRRALAIHVYAFLFFFKNPYTNLSVIHVPGNTSRILTILFAVFSTVKCYAHTSNHNFTSNLKIYRRKEASSLFVTTSLSIVSLSFL